MLTSEQIANLKAGDNITVDETLKNRKRKVYNPYVVIAVNPPDRAGYIKLAKSVQSSATMVNIYNLTDPRLSI